MTTLSETFRVALLAAGRRGHGVALVGGFAVSVRTEPRFTRDVDLVVAVANDAEAEAMVATLLREGHELVASVEQEAVSRLATARFRLRDGALLDLLFASSGIEAEIVAAADQMAVVPGVELPVSTIGHLIAIKLLARDDERRPQDIVDLHSLMKVASPDDLDQARAAVVLIERRGFARGRELVDDLEVLIGGHASRS